MTSSFSERVAVIYDGYAWYAVTPLQAQMYIENVNLSRDLSFSLAHCTDWRARQQVLWADGLHRTLMAGVTF